MPWNFKASAAATLLTIAASAAAPIAAFAQVTVGAYNTGNCYPFSCGPSDGVSEYQQVYSAAAFSGATSFNTLSFFAFGATAGNPMDTATYEILFSVTHAGVNALSGSLASNITGRQQVFGTFTTGGTMPAVLSLTGKDFTYDPSQGNLLMDVLVLNTSFANDRYESYFEADGSGNEVSRAWSSWYGAEADHYGLVTKFTAAAAVPEPASAAILGAAMLGIGLGRRRRAG